MPDLVALELEVGIGRPSGWTAAVDAVGDTVDADVLRDLLAGVPDAWLADRGDDDAAAAPGRRGCRGTPRPHTPRGLGVGRGGVGQRVG